MKIKLNPDQEIVSTIRKRTQAHRRVLPLPQGAHRGNQMYVPGVQESNCRSALRGGLPLYALLQILVGLREESYAVKETGCHR